jgi:hypothetical protein
VDKKAAQVRIKIKNQSKGQYVIKKCGRSPATISLNHRNKKSELTSHEEANNTTKTILTVETIT